MGAACLQNLLPQLERKNLPDISLNPDGIYTAAKDLHDDVGHSRGSITGCSRWALDNIRSLHRTSTQGDQTNSFWLTITARLYAAELSLSERSQDLWLPAGTSRRGGGKLSDN